MVLLNFAVPITIHPAVIQGAGAAGRQACVGEVKSMCRAADAPAEPGRQIVSIDASVQGADRDSAQQEAAAQGSSTVPANAADAASKGTAPLPAASRYSSSPLEAGSPADVAALHAAAAAESSQQTSSAPTTPQTTVSSAGSSSAGGSGRHAPSPSPSHSPTQSDATASELQHLSLAAADTAAAAAAAEEPAGPAALQRSQSVDIPALVQRLKQRPLTGQVVAWGWEAAAAASAVRKTLPAQLFSALWPATQACAGGLMMPQDVLEVLEAWLTLMQQCPRHFRLSKVVLEELATYALPCAVKRMGERQLGQLAGLARDIALHRSDADMQMGMASAGQASARDLMQPFFALAAAEVAWRCSNPARYVSPETVSRVVTAAPAWSWRVVRHRDSQALISLKLATAAALEELVPHSPRDLVQSGALGKLKVGPRSSLGSRGSSVSGAGSGPSHAATH